MLLAVLNLCFDLPLDSNPTAAFWQGREVTSPQKCQFKKKKLHNVSCELSFIWGQNEDYSPGDSTSAEKLLQRSRVEVSIYVILVKGE